MKKLILLLAVFGLAFAGSALGHYWRSGQNVDQMKWEKHSGGFDNYIKFQNLDHGVIRRTKRHSLMTDVFIPCRNYKDRYLVRINNCELANGNRTVATGDWETSNGWN